MGKSIRKVISTGLDVNYQIILQNGKIFGILEEQQGESVFYAEGEETTEINDEVLESILKALLRTKPEEFDILMVCVAGDKEEERYVRIGEKVFKELFNELYNLTFATGVFRRQISLEDLGKTYSFFPEEEDWLFSEYISLIVFRGDVFS